ncbi:FadR/GntR family transcriptional regulator, partial [Bacillus sp. JJ1521]|uniref:FadR/GntR family transcriptional regulator n=1 Tax=Bacillus sp. JJ1521 TaxID=3122957 RepID=UPI003F68B8CD
MRPIFKSTHFKKSGNLSTAVMNEIMNEILKDTDGNMKYLPTENELATNFNVSRITIREAIRGLEERGFV